jgi:DNA mismatch repair protein MutH
MHQNQEDSVPYDKSSVDSIYGFALALTGKSLSEVVELPKDVVNVRNRGDLGRLVEKYYFRHTPPNNHEPDFEDARLELKVTGVVKASDGLLKAKERLVLTNIDYDLIATETWQNNYFRHKCETMLILFYLYSKESSVIDQKFVLKPKIYEFLRFHEEVIREDWLTIQKKVLAGKAHELSEGDTFYLKACRKGPGGPLEKGRKQPFSTEPAKTRAFSLKQGFLTSIIEDHELDGGSIIDGKSTTLADATYNRLIAFQGREVEQISADFHFHKLSINDKGFYRNLTSRMLTNGKNVVRELDMSDVKIKTIRRHKGKKPKESMSFPNFDFLEILNEKWEDSKFAIQLEQKFLFVVFEIGDDGIERFVGAKYWNMPYRDRELARQVWEETKRRVAINAHDLPGSKESEVAHVRPKARNREDKALTPQGDMHTKQCFWLNSSYIAEVLNELKI